MISGSADVNETEQMITVKIRYVIQYRTEYIGCASHLHRFVHDCKIAGCKRVAQYSSWQDGAGYAPHEGGAYEYIFSAKNFLEAKKALKNARRRKHMYKTEYRLVRQESTWTVVD